MIPAAPGGTGAMAGCGRHTPVGPSGERTGAAPGALGSCAGGLIGFVLCVGALIGRGIQMMRRPTIVDIARSAGVSKGAVSCALNGRPGVSDTTRSRILQIAGQLGWAPSSAARALSDGRAGAIGLIIDRPALVLGTETFFMRFLAGIQEELADGGTALMLQSDRKSTR